MSVEQINKTIYRCDVCNGASKMTTSKCSICGKDCCFHCLDGIYDCYLFNICTKCRDNKLIDDFVMKTRDKWNKDRVRLLAKFKESMK